VLSIRRRQGPYEFRKEPAFGSSDPSWPNWGELGPILLRSAGIVGVAGVIMVVAAGDTLFREPLRTPRGNSTASAQSAAVAHEAEPIVVHAPSRLGDEAVMIAAAPPTGAFTPEEHSGSSSQIEDLVAVNPNSTEEPASAKELAVAALRAASDATPSGEVAAITPAEDEQPSAKDIVAALRPSAGEDGSEGDAQAALPMAAEGGASLEPEAAINPAQLRLEPLSEVGPQGYVQSFSPPVSDGDAQPRLIRARDLDLHGASTDAAMPREAEEPSALDADEEAVEVASLSADPPAAEDVDPGTMDRPHGGEALWDDEAVECPRSWLAVSEDSDEVDGEGDASADCEAKFVLVVPAETEATEAAGGEMTLDEALESAAASHALELAGFVARVPVPRPDNPPPVRRVRTGHRADWPAAPPPDCGNLHARWRFVDRKAGTKEWYCR
jgi:hypothetical protein